MAWYLVPSLVALRAQANARYPKRDKSSDGSIGDTAHAKGTSDHNPDWKGAVHAYDLDEDLDGNQADHGAELLFVAEYLRLSRDPRIKYVIYEGRMFASYNSSNGPAWQWRSYTGKNAHRKHLHISVLSTHTGENDTRPWFPGVAPKPPAPKPVHQEDDDMYMIQATGDAAVWLVDANGPTHIRSEATVKAYLASGVKFVRGVHKDDLAAVLAEADVLTRLEWVMADLVNTLKQEQ